MQSNPLHALLVMHLEAFPPGSHDEAARHVFTTEREHVEFRFDGQTVRLPRRLFTLAALAFVDEIERRATERLDMFDPQSLSDYATDYMETPAKLAAAYPLWRAAVEFADGDAGEDPMLIVSKVEAMGYGTRWNRVGQAPVDQFGNVSDLTGDQLKHAQDSGGGDE